MLERACRDRDDRLRLYPSSPLDIAVDVSGREPHSADLLPDAEPVLARTGTDPAAVMLEMTESVLIEDTAETVAVLTALRARGLRLSLDDFGTGFSSLSDLRWLPVDIVKIDQSLVADVGDDDTAVAVVAAITQLARALGLLTVGGGWRPPPSR